MKRFLKWTALVVGALIVLLAIIGVCLTDRYRVSRSIVVAAPVERVHALVGDLRRWDEWGPWQEADPSQVTTLGPVTSGVGATQSWKGDGHHGRLAFTAADPVTGVDFDLFFDGAIEPTKASIRYAPSGSGATTVTWTMEGAITTPVLGGYLAKAMPGMIGPFFDTGLRRIKALSEAAAPAPTPAP